MPRLRGRSVPPPPQSTLVVDVSDRQKLLRISARGLERLVRRALVAEGLPAGAMVTDAQAEGRGAAVRLVN